MEKCFLCQRYRPLETHHIFNGANRKLSEKYGLTVRLCSECHRTSKYSAHNDKHTMSLLKRIGQRKAMDENGWSVDEFIRIFGKNYI